MSQFLQPGIILLREGTDTSQGRGQLVSNINACQAVGDIIRSTLGPRGMDKLVYSAGSHATISNDGAEILKLLDIVHPAAKVLVDIARSQDNEVGDGTTGVTLLACELLKQAKNFIEDGEHPQTIIKGFRKAALLATQHIDKVQVGIDDLKDFEPTVQFGKESQKGTQSTADEGVESQGKGGRMVMTKVRLLELCAATALNSKLIARNKELFARMCVAAVEALDSDLDLSLIGIKKVTGGSVTDTMLIQGVAFKKTFSYAGFEQQPKQLLKPGILAMNVELELKNEKDNAEVTVDNPETYQSIVDAEWQIIYEKLDNCCKSGATVVLSRLPIGDLATQYFADRGIFCAGRVGSDDLERVCKATGAKVVSTTNGLDTASLGHCDLFEEKQVGGERYNFFTGCKEAKTATIVLRGGSEQFVEEAQRSLHDALMVVKRMEEAATVVAGGGAIEMILSRVVYENAKKISGKQQLILEAYAKALEVIPRQLCDNSGLDGNTVLNLLRKKHYVENGMEDTGTIWYGVDVISGGVCDTLKSLVWEPSANKRTAVNAATEAACVVLSIDETVRNPKSEQNQMEERGQLPGGRKPPISQAMGGKGLRGMGEAMAGGAAGFKTLQGRGGK